MTYPNLRAELARKGMTAEQLADKFGITPQTMCNYMSGRTKPDIMLAKSMAAFFGCSVDYLFQTSEDTEV